MSDDRKARVHWCNPGMWAWEIPHEPGMVLVGVETSWRRAFTAAYWAMHWRRHDAEAAHR